MGVKWDLVMVLSHVSLMASDVELFLCTLTMSVINSGKISIQIVCPFMSCLFIIKILKSSSYIVDMFLYPIYDLQVLSLMFGLSFTLLKVSMKHRWLTVKESNSSGGSCVLGILSGNCCLIPGHKNAHLCVLRAFFLAYI